MAAWNRAVEREFDQKAAAEELGWSEEALVAAQEALDEAAQEGALRIFLKSDPFKRNMPGLRSKSPSASEVTEAAAAFLVNNSAQEKRREDETIDADAAIGAVYDALEKELSFRQDHIERMTKRKADLAGTPRKVTISGLRGDSSVANGTYYAHGIRHFWNRPLYTQEQTPDSLGPNYLFCKCSTSISLSLVILGRSLINLRVSTDDMKHRAEEDAKEGAAVEWDEGCWIVGPTLNSDRCTAYAEEGSGPKLMYPPSTGDGATQWFAFDLVAKNWRPAPGKHCPGYAVVAQDDGDDDLTEYIQQGINDEKRMHAHIAEQIGPDTPFRKTTDLTIRAYGEKGGSNVSRLSFMTWRSKFLKDEVAGLKVKLRVPSPDKKYAIIPHNLPLILGL